MPRYKCNGCKSNFYESEDENMKIEEKYFCSHCFYYAKKCVICNEIKIMKKNINYDCSICEECNKKIGIIAGFTNKFLILRFHTLKRDGFTCRYCGRSPITDIKVELEIDHIQPRSKGGEDKISNLITSCKECNLGKMAIILSDAQNSMLIRRRIYNE